MTGLLTPEEFVRLFDSFSKTAFRLETRDAYEDESEHEPFRRFLAGEPADDFWMAEFCETLRGWAAEGKRLSRVRVITEPHSDYVRWSMTVARLNIEAGEDIRYLPRSKAKELDLPDEDYWLFDERHVAVLDLDESGRLLGAELIDDPAEVAKRRRWRDVAWQDAIAWGQYARS